MNYVNFRISSTKFFLLLACALSLGLIVTVDSTACNILNNYFPSFLGVAQIRIFSLIACFSLYQFSKHLTPPIQETPNRRKAFLISTLWMVLAIYFVLIEKIPVLQAKGWMDLTSFAITGLLAEEFLFRGCIYELIKKIYPHLYFRRISGAILISALLFGLQHFSYHHFLFSSEALTQVIGTFIMGLFLGYVREFSGQLWPVILLHFLNNSLTVIRNIYF